MIYKIGYKHSRVCTTNQDYIHQVAQFRICNITSASVWTKAPYGTLPMLYTLSVITTLTIDFDKHFISDAPKLMTYIRPIFLPNFSFSCIEDKMPNRSS